MGRPKHEQVREKVLDILSSMGENQPLETERELAERFAVSRMTIRQALSSLREEGLIRSVRGVGTFAARPRVSKAPALTSFSEDLASRGYVPTTKVISSSIEVASPDIALDLGIPTGSNVYRIERLRLADGVPLCIETVHLHAEMFPDLLSHNLENSLYATLEGSYGVQLRRGDQTVRAVNTSEYEADLLGIPVGTAALHMKRVTAGQTGKAVERGMAVCRGDLYDYQFVVVRPSRIGPN